MAARYVTAHPELVEGHERTFFPLVWFDRLTTSGQWALLAGQLVLLLAAAALSALAFSHSFLGEPTGQALVELAKILRIPIGSAADTAYVYVFALLAVPALVQLLFGGIRELKLLAGLYLIFLHGPGIMAHSTLNWLRFLLQRPFTLAAAPLAESVALALGTAACLAALFLVVRQRQELKEMEAQRVEFADARSYVKGSLAVGVAVVAGALVSTLVVMLLAFGVSTGFVQVISSAPWPLVLLGLLAVVWIAAMVYLALPASSPE